METVLNLSLMDLYILNIPECWSVLQCSNMVGKFFYLFPCLGNSSTIHAPTQTRPHATVEVEISEDMQLVHFDFNSIPFELHDDNYVLKAMKFCERPQSDTTTLNLINGGDCSSMSGGLYDAQVPTLVLNPPVRTPSSPPLPGILKARVKNEH